MKKHTFLFALLGISTLTLLARQGAQDMNPLAAGASNHPPALSHADLTNTKEGEPESALPLPGYNRALRNCTRWRAKLPGPGWITSTGYPLPTKGKRRQPCSGRMGS
jgi:hypothetical protein